MPYDIRVMDIYLSEANGIELLKPIPILIGVRPEERMHVMVQKSRTMEQIPS